MKKGIFIILILLLLIGCENKEFVDDYNASIEKNNTAKLHECYGECTESSRYCVSTCMNKNCEILFSDLGEKQDCFDKLFEPCIDQCNFPSSMCIEHCSKTHLIVDNP